MEHLDENQRYFIFKSLQAHESKSEIAKRLGVDRSTIYREIKRNSVNGKYRSGTAERIAMARQHEGHKHYKYGQQTWDEVCSMLRQDYSPEQVNGRLRRLGKPAPSTECIYQYIWEQKLYGNDLHKHLRHKCKKQGSRGRVKERRGRMPNRKGIELRPSVVDRKERFGDLEIDTVIGKNKKGALLTINDRAGMVLWIRKLSGKNAEELAEATINVLRPLKKLGVLHTITSDNGKEFACHEKIAKKLKVEFFFARPYCSCDRGANENMNGLIRQYLPKGTDFENITPEDIQKIEDKLNNRPRKRLDYMTPKEYILRKFNILLH